MSKLFEPGVFVVYCNRDVCKIADITTMRFDFQDERKYYVLSPVYDEKAQFYLPVDNTDNKLREPITKEEANALIDEIPLLQPIEPVPGEKAMGRQAMAMLYKEALRNGDAHERIRVLKTIYDSNQKRLSEGKKVLQSNAAIKESAEAAFFGEVAFALDIPCEDVCAYIESRLGDAEA